MNDDYLKNIKNTLEIISSKKEIKHLFNDAPYWNCYLGIEIEDDLMLTLQNESFDNAVTRFYISEINQNNFRQFRNKCKDQNSYSPYSNNASEFCLWTKKRQAVFGDLYDPYNQQV